jgi:hypothetical protein
MESTHHQEETATKSCRADDANIQKVYEEASNWLRTVNIVTWSMAAIFIPLSLACFPLAMKTPEYGLVFAFASCLLYGIWVYIGLLYSRSADVTRDALFHAEEMWNLPHEMRFYSVQGKPAQRWYGLHSIQHLTFFALILVWICFLTW